MKKDNEKKNKKQDKKATEKQDKKARHCGLNGGGAVKENLRGDP